MSTFPCCAYIYIYTFIYILYIYILYIIYIHIYIYIYINDSSAKYYQGNKERIQKKLVKDMKVSLKKKKKQKDNCREQYKYLPEEEKQKLVEYRKIYCQMK